MSFTLAPAATSCLADARSPTRAANISAASQFAMMLPKYRWLPSNVSKLVSVLPSGFGSRTAATGAGPAAENMSSVPATEESSMSSGIVHASTCAGKLVTGDSTWTGAMPEGLR